MLEALPSNQFQLKQDEIYFQWQGKPLLSVTVISGLGLILHQMDHLRSMAHMRMQFYSGCLIYVPASICLNSNICLG